MSKRTVACLGLIVGCLLVIAASSADLARGDTDAPAGAFVYERQTKTGRWLESRDLHGGSRVALTFPVTPGEQRQDCCAIWSPDGTRIAFMRRTPRENGIFVVDADGRHLRRLVSESQFRSVVPKGKAWFADLNWSTDGDKLLFALSRRYSCNGEAVYRIDADGSALRPLWRRPARLTAQVFANGWSPDGAKALLVISHNDGDCYGIHVGASELLAVPDGVGARAPLREADGLGSPAWSPDGSAIVFTECPIYDPCNFGVVSARGQGAHLLTHFASSTSPYPGFDWIDFHWAQDGTGLIFGRSLSLLMLDHRTKTITRVTSFPCPRPSGRCRLPLTGVYAVSDRWAIVEVADIGCAICEAGSPDPISKRYAAPLAGGAPIELPNPNLQVDDLFLP